MYGYNNGIVFSCSDRWVDPLVDTDVFMARVTEKNMFSLYDYIRYRYASLTFHM